MSTVALVGKRVAITRPIAQSQKWVTALHKVGAVCEAIPLIQIDQPDDEGFAFEQAMRKIDEYAWIICTSSNGATRVAPYLPKHSSHVQLAAVGESTAQAFGREVAFIPLSATGHALANEFPHTDSKVLLVTAQETNGEVERILRDRGIEVEVVSAYQTNQRHISAEEINRIQQCDAVLFASGSAVRSWVAQSEAKTSGAVVVIGDATLQVAKGCGLTVQAVATSASADGIVTALAGVFA